MVVCKEMTDLTIIYITANKLKEHFAESIREQLLVARGDYELISVSQKPMDFGDKNVCVGDIGISAVNIYKQILEGAKASETKYIAIAEDDTLYSPSHFSFYRPSDDALGYDMTKWSLYTWKAVYSVKRRISTAGLICTKDLLIEALEERFSVASGVKEKYWGELGRLDGVLGTTEHKVEQFYSPDGIVIFSHPEAMGYGSLGKRKRVGNFLAYDIPYWGHVNEVIRCYTT